MSRSRKKKAQVSDYSRSYTKWAKRQASKAVRRYKGDLTCGAYYKRLYDSYNICDWYFIYTPDDGELYFKAIRK